jgi:hypothetical protein
VAQRLGIDRAVKDPRDRTSFAVLERAIQTVKKLLAFRQERGEAWPAALPKVVRQYNKDPLGTTGVAPGDVENNRVAQFWIKDQMADAIAHNKEVQDQREAKIAEVGGYREPTQESKGWFQRGFKPRMSEPKALVDGPDRFAFARAHAEDGTEVPSKLAQPSRVTMQPISEGEVDPIRAAFRGAAEQVAAVVRASGPMAMVDVARLLQRRPGFDALLKRSRKKGLTNVLKAFPELLKVDRGVVVLPGQDRPPVVRMRILRPRVAPVDPDDDTDTEEAALAVAQGAAQPPRSNPMPPPPVPDRRVRFDDPAIIRDPTQPQAFAQPDASQASGFLGRPDGRTAVPSTAASVAGEVEDVGEDDAWRALVTQAEEATKLKTIVGSGQMDGKVMRLQKKFNWDLRVAQTAMTNAVEAYTTDPRRAKMAFNRALDEGARDASLPELTGAQRDKVVSLLQGAPNKSLTIATLVNQKMPDLKKVYGPTGAKEVLRGAVDARWTYEDLRRSSKENSDELRLASQSQPQAASSSGEPRLTDAEWAEVRAYVAAQPSRGAKPKFIADDPRFAPLVAKYTKALFRDLLTRPLPGSDLRHDAVLGLILG